MSNQSSTLDSKTLLVAAGAIVGIAVLYKLFGPKKSRSKGVKDEAAYNLKTRAKVAKKEPAAVDVEKGKTYYWCTCGLSKNQPFCDGSHKEGNKVNGTDFKSMPYVAEKTETLWFCQCKQTKTPPFCDGAHDSL